MRKFYTFVLFLLLGFTSFGQIVANDDYMGANCGFQYIDDPQQNVLYNDRINNVAFPYTNVILTVFENQYPDIIGLNTDSTSPYYGSVTLVNPTAYGSFTFTYRICQVGNPTNCDMGYVTFYNYPESLSAYPDNFSNEPINNAVGGTTVNSVISNDYSSCFGSLAPWNYMVTAGFDVPSSFSVNPDGTITVQAGVAPGSYIFNYNLCNYSGNCSGSSVTILVTGISDIVANYDDFSYPNYPNTVTESVLSNDTLNGGPATISTVTITPLNIPSGFTLNTTTGTISIGNVSEGTYAVPYRICDNVNPANCYVNYAYVVVLKNKIGGTVQFDDENNGCDGTDSYLYNIKVKNINGTSTYVSTTYGNPHYYLIGDAGTNTISVTDLPPYFTVTPANHIFNLSTPGTTFGGDFCITANANINDLQIELVPLFNVVPGLPALYDIWFKNNGSTTLNGQVTFQFDNTKMSFLSSNPLPDATSSNSLTYNFTGLPPFQYSVIRNVKFQVAIPPTVDLGNVVTFTGVINPVASDATPTNNTSIVSQTVVNSQDPNDITVSKTNITLSEAQQDYLYYTIRFQNVGTSDAINIKVLNDLDINLNWSTLELIGTSHQCRLKNTNNHNEFLFENINLPGTNNEPLSHGYIHYKVKPISTIAIGNVIPNVASIYFDYNAPITTNTITTTVSALGNTNFAFTNLNYFPNPIKNSLTISNASIINAVEITSVLGQRIIHKSVNDLQTEIDLSQLSTGIYLVKISSDGQEKKVKIIKE